MSRTASATAQIPEKNQPNRANRRHPLPERMLTLPQAASYLAISQQTLRRYVKQGKIPFRRVGDEDRYMYRFDLSDLQNFAQKRSA
jgi:excisionase family DNA binding protein